MNKDCYLIFEQYRLISENLILENVQKAIEIRNKYYPSLKYQGELIGDYEVEEIYNALARQQVAKTIYLNWIFLLIQNRVPRIMEDLQTIAKNLKVFNSKSSKIAADGYPTQLFKPNKELIYKTPQDLYKVVENYMNTDDVGERGLLKTAEYLKSKGEVGKIYEDDVYAVYTPKTYDASKELACLTNWCTRFPDMYKRYSGDGPLYIILNKQSLGNTEDNNRMIQFHIPSKQFKDIKDREIRERPVFMNNLKGLFNTLYPNALSQFKKLSNGEIERSELSDEAKQSLYLMPQEYKEGLNLPCGEMEEKIASELGVDCALVFETDGRYEVNGEIYEVQEVSQVKNQAVEGILDSGLESDWFYKNVLDYGRQYSWETIYRKEEYENTHWNQRKYEFEDLFGNDNYVEIYNEHLKPYLSEEEEYKVRKATEYGYDTWVETKLPPKVYDEYDLEDGSYLKDVPYEVYISFMEDFRGDNPIKWYVEERGDNVQDIPNIDLDAAVGEFVENLNWDDLVSWSGSYDGTGYNFDLNGTEYMLYRME